MTTPHEDTPAGIGDWQNTPEFQAAAFAGLADNPATPERDRARLREQSYAAAEQAERVREAARRSMRPDVATTSDLLSAVREARALIVASNAQDERARLTLAVLDVIEPFDVDYPTDIRESEFAGQVAGAARFVTGLADALGDYIKTGVVVPVPTPATEPDETES